MSYIELQLGGELRGLKFNNAAVDCYWQRVNFDEVIASSVYATVYSGLIGNDLAKGVQYSNYTYEQVTEWVDDLYNTDEESLTKACELFAETTAYKKKLEKMQERIRLLNEEGQKKKTEKEVA
jgi:hypothetical protein